MFTKKLSEPWFTHVKNGTKTIEGRLNDGDWSNMKPGDCIDFVRNDDSKNPEKCSVVVIRVTPYTSFLEMLRREGLRYCLPEIQTAEEGAAIYRQFYSSDLESKKGVIAISICLIKR